MDFIHLVLNNISAETQGTALQTLLRQLMTAAKIYTHEATRKSAWKLIADRLLELAASASAGSDGQLMFTRFATYFAAHDEAADILEGLLDGSIVFEGLGIDHEVRWDLVNGLVMAGRFSSEQISVELEKDKTANGAKQAMLARMSVPTADAKKKGWFEILNNPELSNTDINFGCTGLIRAHDVSLLEPLVDWYFDAALDVWNTRTFKIAEYILRGAFPIYLANQQLADRTRAFANLPEIAEKPALRRIILENLDSTERALKAQKRDN